MFPDKGRPIKTLFVRQAPTLAASLKMSDALNLNLIGHSAYMVSYLEVVDVSDAQLLLRFFPGVSHVFQLSVEVFGDQV